MNPASRDQVVALHAIYSKWESHAIQEARDSRAERLAWASGEIGHPISSFTDLTRDEARQLIDALKGSIGQAITEPPQPWRRVRARDRAHATGTAGRKGSSSSFIQMASPDDHARIQEALRRLGWSSEQFQSWLQSKYSPTTSHDQVVIRTVAEANRVWWALKAMLRRSGEWRQSKGTRGSRRVSG
jgi:hypothetical protein